MTPLRRGLRRARRLYSSETRPHRHDLTRGDHEATHHPRERVPHRRRRLGPPPLRRAHPSAPRHELQRVLRRGQREERAGRHLRPGALLDAHGAARRAAGAGLPGDQPRGAGPLGLHAAAPAALPRSDDRLQREGAGDAHRPPARGRRALPGRGRRRHAEPRRQDADVPVHAVGALARDDEHLAGARTRSSSAATSSARTTPPTTSSPTSTRSTTAPSATTPRS